ncbi:MAG: hypothetical protein GY805_22530, partial [Chloroflexi bacterium]|nr:hypothetical protein [Chloroflexota bacterium]
DGLFLAAKLLYEDGEGKTAVSIIHALHSHPMAKAHLIKKIKGWLDKHSVIHPSPEHDTDSQHNSLETWAKKVLAYC